MHPNDTRPCQTCGAPFVPRADHLRDGMGRFCSRRCAARSRTHDTIALFWSKVDRSGGPDACWPFVGCITRAGYGQISAKGKRVYAHRFAHEQTVGPIPDGWHLHHACKNRRCCNPAHLEPMPQPEHASRDSFQARKAHCPRGHPYDGANTGRNPGGGRYCRACNRARSSRHYHSHRTPRPE